MLPTVVRVDSISTSSLNASPSGVSTATVNGVWSIASGSSRESGRPWAVAGAGWQGRRPAGIPLGFQGSRTPPGGDQRPIQGCQDLREGALLLRRLDDVVDR